MSAHDKTRTTPTARIYSADEVAALAADMTLLLRTVTDPAAASWVVLLRDLSASVVHHAARADAAEARAVEGEVAQVTRERDEAVDAVRADYAPRARATPPTVDEVRALSVKQCREDVMAQVLVRDGLGDWYLCMLGVRSGAVYGLGRSDDLVMRRSDGWLAIGPDGLVPWSELARLVAQGGAR